MKTSSWASAVIACVLVFHVGQAPAADSVAQLRASGARVVADPKIGITRFIGFDAQAVADRSALAGQPANAALQQMPTEAAAAQHLSNYAELFGLRDAASETRTIKHRVREGGRSMTRYQQLHQGVPVIAGELIVNQTAQRQLTSISGKISPELNVDTTPVITAEQARTIARHAMVKWYQLSEDEFVVPEPTLSIYDSRLMSPHADPVALVWRVDVTTRSLRPINEFMAVDAKSGVIALHFNQVPHAKKRITYDANNTTILPGTFVCDEFNPACAGGIPDAVSAHLYAGKTYDFYATNFGRDGIDGAGMTMKSTVRYCKPGEVCPTDNAFWLGTQMAYGMYLSRAEDLVGHELTHGVTDHESVLFYYYQSGAINESLSDVFGEFIQQSDPSGTVTLATKWQIAEDLAPYRFRWGAYMRSMSNPPAKGDPDRMTSPNYEYDINMADQGGVHANSGINNKAAYLMVDGGFFNNMTVTPIGLTKVAKIYYEVQTNLLTSGSDYLDLYSALYQACQNLVGIGSPGFVASDCQQVRNATNAVEMYKEPVAGYNPEAGVCPDGQVANNLYLTVNGFEGPPDLQGTSNVWLRTTDFARAGKWGLYGRGYAGYGISERAKFINPVTLPANAFVRFDHAFEFEAGYDGGIVEYSVAGGPWTQLTSSTAGQAHSGVIYYFSSNPLAGKLAFSGSSHGYVSTRFDLSSLAGQSVHIGWRLGTDNSIPSTGWWIDNAQVYTCQPGFVLSVTNTGAGSGTVSSSPAGIDACSLPCSAGFASGAVVTLTATPATGSTFAGWSGACPGAGTCTVTMNAEKNVTANFTKPPTAPTMGTATAGAGQLSVSFTPGSLNGGTLTNHQVTCTATSGPSYNGYRTSSPIIVTGLTNGVAYHCWARTLTNHGTSPWSGASNWATPTSGGQPAAPVMGTATAGAGQLSVSFTPGNLNGGTLTNHHVTCTAASGPAYNGYRTSSPIIVTGLTSGVAYHCWVRTLTNLGTSPWSGASNWATPTGGGQPAAPIMGKATAGAGQLSVSFTPGSLNGGTLTNHQVTCAAASGPAYNGYRTSSPIIVAGLTSGVAYRCWARTLTNQGTSPWSGASNWATPTGGGQPAAPIMGTATAGAGQLSVSFTPGNLNGGTLTYHHVTCAATTGPAYNGYRTSSPIVVAGLIGGVAYRCWARTVTNLGTSSWSGASNWATPTP